MRMITVKVTQEHIDAANQLDGEAICATCPLSLALQDSGFPDAWVTKRVWRSAAFDLCEFPLPDDAILFIDAFDHRLPVRPQTFRLQAPEAGGAGEGGG